MARVALALALLLLAACGGATKQANEIVQDDFLNLKVTSCQKVSSNSVTEKWNCIIEDQLTGKRVPSTFLHFKTTDDWAQMPGDLPLEWYGPPYIREP